MPSPVQRCYPAGKNTALTAVAYVLLALGVLLLFVCIPCWAWLALIGLGLIAAGLLLLKLNSAWR